MVRYPCDDNNSFDIQLTRITARLRGQGMELLSSDAIGKDSAVAISNLLFYQLPRSLREGDIILAPPETSHPLRALYGSLADPSKSL